MKFGIGQSVRRKEDERLTTGRGCFVEDLSDEKTLCAHIVRSPVAHALIASIDVQNAQNAPGVHAVLLGKDYVADGHTGLRCSTILPNIHKDARPVAANPIAEDRVLFVGMCIAVVIADTASAAQAAADLIEIDYEELPVVITPAQALAPDAPLLWPDQPDNVALRVELGDSASTDEAIASAAHVTHLKFHNNRLSANALETRGALASFEPGSGRVTLTCSTQVPHTVQGQVAQSLGIPQSQIRVMAHDVGGGFGMKGGVYPEDILVAWAARRLRAKVAWQATRSDSLMSDYHGRDQWVEAELALDDAGHITALRMKCEFNTGAYMSPGAGVSPMFASTLATGCYRVPTAHAHARAVFTNTSPTQPYRGAGRPEAAYLIERLIDKAAAETGRDRIALRRANMLKPTDMPYKTPLLYVIDSGDYGAVVDRAMHLSDWAGFTARRDAAADEGKLRGIGIALHMENAGLANEQAEIRFDPDGGVAVLAGTFSHGQGHETVFAQMVSDWLGVPFESVRLIQGDTDAVGFGRGTVASRSIINGGGSLRQAADQVIGKAKAIAAHLMDVAPEDIDFDDGELAARGTNKKMLIGEVAAMSFRPMLPPDLGIGLSGQGAFLLQGFAFPNGCQVVEVEVDPDTGVTQILNLVSVDDVGTVINPMLLDGQLVGGIAQGLGQAMMEDVVYDDDGQLLTGSFMDYAMPRADDMPPIHVEVLSTPTATNPLGAKGVGEAGTVGATPAIMSAILDALAPVGVTDLALPATPQRVWQAIQNAKAS